MLLRLLLPLTDVALCLLAPPKCAACDAHLSREAALCASCVTTLEPPPELPRDATAAFSYGGALSEAVHRFKYGGKPELARPLGRLVVEGLPDRRSIDAVVPVPLHVARLRERGFDQATLLAAAVSRALRRPIAHLLARVVDTPQLARLDAEARAVAVRSAFSAKNCSGIRVLLIDDVRTTGATLLAAATALTAHGARVSTHVLAATPRG